ncbi:calcium-binding protein [Sorangium sp. So ce1036]|uniref:calcium-binding protein n=1 Tax=Sorangium sp. So ce1036 TaxID=3133328 RepID=UPI003F01FB4B
MSACTAHDVPVEDVLPSGGIDPVTLEATGEGAEDDEISGTPGDDVLEGTEAGDIISGLDGNDTIHGRFGDDLLFGDGGDDVLLGDDGDDILEGGVGDDDLTGGSGADHMNGGSGNDVMRGGDGADTYYYSQGQDIIHNVDVAGHGNIDVDTVIIDTHSTPPDHVVFQQDLTDLLISFPGRPDTLRILSFFGGNGAAGGTVDRIRFGNQSDTWEMSADEVAYIALYGSGTPIIGTSLEDDLRGAAQQDLLWGRAGDDVLIGYHGNDGLYGESGYDVLLGGPGADELEGGLDNDLLHGGHGSDSYIFKPGDGNDVIYQPSEPDWSVNYDYIKIDGPESVIDGASFHRPNDTDLVLRLAPEHNLAIRVMGFFDPVTGLVADPNEVDDVRWPDRTLCRSWMIRNALAAVPIGTAVDVRTTCGTSMRW